MLLKNVVFSLLLLTSLPLFAKGNWRGYLQGDYTSSDNPQNNHGFQLRRINLIFNRAVSTKVRAFADIEYEDGAELNGNGGEGEIKISRGFAEFRLGRDLKLAAGKFLTPFGYYNEIHDFSASYIPIDPPKLIYGNNQIFGTNNKRLYSKYSTGLRFLYQKENLSIKTGLANGANQTSSGTDSNKTPMAFFKVEYGFLDNSTISASYIKDKVNTNREPKWEDHGNVALNIELYKYFLISEAGLGNTRNSSSHTESKGYFNQSHLLGMYLGDSYAFYFNYQSLLPDRNESSTLFQHYMLGFNYHYNYFTIIKAEVQQSNIKILDQKNDYLTQQLSLSMLF